MDPARKEIFDRLRSMEGVIQLPEIPDFNSPLYLPLEGSLTEAFKLANEQITSKTALFNSESELYAALKNIIKERCWKNIHCMEPNLLEKLKESNIPVSSGENINHNIEAGITGCEFLIARTGSALVSSFQPGARRMFVYPPIHIIIANENQLVDSLESAYHKITKKYMGDLPSLITLISGPSRTADIEKTLVLGAHGPKELIILISK